MPICITCSTPVRNLYTTYSKADDRSLGKGVRLTQCPRCKRFADKYVEHDYVVLFIDLVLIKPQVYRHLLFNRLGRTDDKLDPSIVRLGILLILFDVYITWARIEKSNDAFSTSPHFSSALIITQYLFFLTLNVLATLAQHMTIRLLVAWFVNRPPLTSGQHDRQWSLTGAGAVAVSTATAILSTTEESRHREHSPNKSSLRRSSPMKQGSQRNLVGRVNNSTDHLHNHHPGERNDIEPHHPRSHSQTSLPTVINSPQQQMEGSLTSPISPSSPASGIGIGIGSGAVAAVTIPYTVRPGHASSSAITTALLVSSCTKLFPILLVIWPTTTTTNVSDTSNSMLSSSSESLLESSSSMTGSFAHRASSYIGWIVLLNNIEALYILLDCGYLVAGLVAVSGLLSRWLVEGWILGLVDLVRDGGGFGDGPVSDTLALWSWLNGKI